MKKLAFIPILLMIFLLTGAANPYKIFIDGEVSCVYLLKDDKLLKTYKCATGKYKTPSPIGTFSVNRKGDWGDAFGGSFIGLDVPWGNFGMHGTPHPESVGWNSSMCCFRMYNTDAAELLKIIPIGTRVAAVNGPFGDFGSGFRNITPGQYGSDVMRIQKRLSELGYYSGSPDGKYGEILQSAVHRFQEDNSFTISNTITPSLQEKMGFILME